MPPKRKIVRLRDSLRSSSFRVEVKSYCENSSIHGVKYIIEKHRPNFERLLWTVVLTVALIYAGIYTLDIWNETPILTEEHAIHGNHRVPMPGVTICSNAKVARTSNWGQERSKSKDLHTLRFLCGEAFPNSRTISVKRMNETAPNFHNTCTLDMVLSDGNLTQQVCQDMFQKVMSEQGVCYTFNSYHPKHVYRDDVKLGDLDAIKFGTYDPDFGKVNGTQHPCGNWDDGPMLLNKYQPKGGVTDHLKCGNHTLKVSMYIKQDDVGHCTFRNESGFKVIIHNPKDAPSIGIRRLIWTREEDSLYHTIDVKAETKVIVKVEGKLTSHTPDLLWFNPKKRECYDENERYLRFFKIYTKYNCMIECLANLTVKLCDCVDFYMPRVGDTVVCKRVHLPCIFDVIDLFRKKDYCDCYPACYHLDYETQTRAINDTGNLAGIWNDTSITVRLDKNVTEYQRRPSFTDVKVISNCGGIYGFFAGLSLLSVFELIYFFGIRKCAACGGIYGIFCGISVLSLVELFYFSFIRACGNYYKNFKERFF